MLMTWRWKTNAFGKLSWTPDTRAAQAGKPENGIRLDDFKRLTNRNVDAVNPLESKLDQGKLMSLCVESHERKPRGKACQINDNSSWKMRCQRSRQWGKIHSVSKRFKRVHSWNFCETMKYVEQARTQWQSGGRLCSPGNVLEKKRIFWRQYPVANSNPLSLIRFNSFDSNPQSTRHSRKSC